VNGAPISHTANASGSGVAAHGGRLRSIAAAPARSGFGFLFPAGRLALAEAAGAFPPFIFSAMHLSTTSTRLSRFMSAWPFSVDIQHISAALVWVIGGSGAGFAAAVGPEPVVSQPPSVAARSTMGRIRKRLCMVSGKEEMVRIIACAIF